jgi:hypothetical protein
MLNGKNVTYQFFDGDALPQPVQRQDGLDGRHAARVLLDERLPVDRLVILEISWRVCKLITFLEYLLEHASILL